MPISDPKHDIQWSSSLHLDKAAAAAATANRLIFNSSSLNEIPSIPSPMSESTDFTFSSNNDDASNLQNTLNVTDIATSVINNTAERQPGNNRIFRSNRKRRKDVSPINIPGERSVSGERPEIRKKQGKLDESRLSDKETFEFSLSTNNRYDVTTRGPYYVIIQSSNELPTSVDPIVVGRLLYTGHNKEIVKLRKVGFSKISIQFKSRDAANSLVSNPVLKEKKLKAYIPLFRTTRMGVIRGVPLDLSNEEILKGLETKSTIINSVQRLNRNTKSVSQSTLSETGNASSNIVPSKTILITFKGQALPNEVYLYMVRHSVAPFIPKTSLCFSCYRFGHLRSQCKGRARCLYCGDEEHANNEACPKKDNPPVCINCKGNHRASNFNCPEYALQRQIRELAATENISLLDANNRVRRQWRKTDPNINDNLINDNFGNYNLRNFPHLPNSFQVPVFNEARPSHPQGPSRSYAQQLISPLSFPGPQSYPSYLTRNFNLGKGAALPQGEQSEASETRANLNPCITGPLAKLRDQCEKIILKANDNNNNFLHQSSSRTSESHPRPSTDPPPLSRLMEDFHRVRVTGWL